MDTPEWLKPEIEKTVIEIREFFFKRYGSDAQDYGIVFNQIVEAFPTNGSSVLWDSPNLWNAARLAENLINLEEGATNAW